MDGIGAAVECEAQGCVSTPLSDQPKQPLSASLHGSFGELIQEYRQDSSEKIFRILARVKPRWADL